jgi:hypothetical protein
MKRPPFWVKFQVHSRKWRFSLWLPLFLILPLVAAFVLALLPFILIAALVQRCRGRGKPLLLAGPAVVRIIWALRGLEMDVERRSERVCISFR